MHELTSRRQFVKQAVMGAASLAVAGESIQAAAASDGTTPSITLFTKHLQGLKFDELAEAVASIGVNGVEAPVRKDGHVEPERVEEDLPKLAEALKKVGVELTMITTTINDVSDEQYTERILKTAKSLGVSCFRMGYYRYDLTKPVWEQVQSWKPALKNVVECSKDIGIKPLYQNHSTKTFFGAAVWDAYELLREYDPKDAAFAFDIMHATIEGSESWPLEFALVQDRIGAAYFKNFQWNGRKHLNCPLGEGIVGKDYVTMLKKTKLQGPVCLHIEFLEGSIKEKGYLDKAIAATKTDLATLKEWWQTA